MSLAEIAADTGIARSSVYRLIDALVEIELVEQLADSRVRLSRRWLRLADAAVLGFTEWTGAQGVLDDLARAVGLTAFLTVLENDRATCVFWAQSSGIDLLELRPGRSLPLNAGAAGRCFLAFDDEVASRLIDTEEWPVFTDRTLADAEALWEDVRLSRDRGYVLSDEDVTAGIGALGVPLWRGGRLVGCLSVAGLAEVLRRDQRELADRARATAENLLR